MNFRDALQELKSKNKVARSGWNGIGLWLELQTPDANSKMTLPYIYINYPDDAKTTPGGKGTVAGLADRYAGRGLGDCCLARSSVTGGCW